EVGQWLHAESVTTDWRPVPLREGIYNLGQLQFNDGSSRAIQSGTKTPVLDIALDVLSSGGQALIFTETRRSAVEMGRKAALAVGVNLPARTVIISSYERFESGHGRYPISVLEYKQFCGRAGRPKYDKYGESVLIARNQDEADWLMENYVIAQPEKLWSKLAV